MSEYDLVCDFCGSVLDFGHGVVSWTSEANSERGFALGHLACVPAATTELAEVRDLISPNGYLQFVSARLGRTIPDPEPLSNILWALAAFVMRPDNEAEMDGFRAASFGAIPGVKPETSMKWRPLRLQEWLASRMPPGHR